MNGSVEILKQKPTHKEQSRDWPQVLALLTAALASFNCGMLYTWPSPAIPKLLTKDYNIDIEAASYLTVIPSVGMILVSPLSCRLIDIIGRKYTLLISAFLQVGAWLLIAFAESIYVFYGSRLLSGTADGIVFGTLPIYMAEVSTPRVRGIWGNAMMLLMFSGQLVINGVGYYCSIRTTALIMLAFPILFFSSFICMPETPYYYIMKNDINSARRSLTTLRRIKNVDDELLQLTLDLKRQLSESGKFRDLFVIASNRKAITIGVLTRLAQQFSGITAISVYIQYIFMQTSSSISSGHSSMLFASMLAFANSFANLITDKLGRTKSMVFSGIGCGTALIGETIYFYLDSYTDVDLSYFTWIPIIVLFIYVILFTIGLGIVPTLLLGEIFSTSIRGQATLFMNISFGIILCVVTKVFQYLMTAFGLCVPFCFFAVCCFIGAITSHFIVPETRGKTLEEIQQMLKK